MTLLGRVHPVVFFPGGDLGAAQLHAPRFAAHRRASKYLRAAGNGGPGGLGSRSVLGPAGKGGQQLSHGALGSRCGAARLEDQPEDTLALGLGLPEVDSDRLLGEGR